MSGEMQSDNEEIQRVISRLDELLESKGLDDTAKFVNEYTKTALKLNHQQIKSMHKEDLIETAFLLRQYALNVTIDINKYSSIINYCKSRINNQIVKTDLGDIYNYDLKVSRIVIENEYAKKLYKAQQLYEAYKEQLNNVSFSISKMADTLENLARNREFAKGRM